MMHLGIHHSNRDDQPAVHWACVVGPGGQRVVLHQLVLHIRHELRCRSPRARECFFLRSNPTGSPPHKSTVKTERIRAFHPVVPAATGEPDVALGIVAVCLALPVPFDRLLRAFFGKIVAGSDGRRNVDYRRCTEIVSKSPQIFLSQRQGARTRRNVFW